MELLMLIRNTGTRLDTDRDLISDDNCSRAPHSACKLHYLDPEYRYFIIKLS